MGQQVDIAVDLGALPEIVSLRDFAASNPVPPPQLIEGVLCGKCQNVPDLQSVRDSMRYCADHLEPSTWFKWMATASARERT